MMKTDLVNKLQAMIPSQIKEISVPREERIFVRLDKEHLKKFIRYLMDEGFSHLAGITALQDEGGFELLYHLTKKGIILTAKVDLPLNDDCVPSISDIFFAALLYEREAHDLYGIKFEGHPNLGPLILPEGWPKSIHPLRKGKTRVKEKRGRGRLA
ncbi:MAG: NADH-quinone oxidoreductase subunit C [Nitrososphaerota archaeon]|nr:NADH-quinone oxidoreductase subunit C [Candidatus Bathyarchaeota archaeon]MDW8048203.1 NADH-quinone oxidoreductase subunit C [Nitrososphaerota archaeon]